MVEDVHCVRGVLPDGGDVGGREVGCHGLDSHARLAHDLPKFVEGIGTLAVSHIHDLAGLEVYHDGLVHVPFLHGESVNADDL